MPDRPPSPRSWVPLALASRNLEPEPLASSPGWKTSTTAESQIVFGASPSVVEALPSVAVPVVQAVFTSGSGSDTVIRCVHVYVTVSPAARGSPEPWRVFGAGFCPGAQGGGGKTVVSGAGPR